MSTTVEFRPTYTQDGHVKHILGAGAGLAWSALRAEAGNDGPVTTFVMIAQISCDSTGNDGKWRGISRGIFMFDTSTLPATATILSARLRLYGKYNIASADCDDVCVVTSAPASDTSVVAGDYDSLGDTALSDVIAIGDFVVGAYNNFTLNSAGIAVISKTGVTKLGTREYTHDLGGVAPTWAADATGYIGVEKSNAGVSIGPILEVTYTFDSVQVVTLDGTAISDDVLNARYERGKDEELEEATTGTLELRVKNVSGKYNPENASSPLYGKLVPGKVVVFQCIFSGITRDLFYGRLERIVPHPNPNTQDAYLYVLDGIDFLSRAECNVTLQTAVGTHTILGDILDDVGWAAAKRSISDGHATLPITNWFLDKALEAVQEIESCEFGLVYVDELGKFVFEDRHYRITETRCITSQATFNDTMVDIEYDYGAGRIYNDVTGEFLSWEAAGSAEEVGRLSDENPKIPYGESKIFWLEFEDISGSVTTPVVATDVQATTSTGGAGTNKNSDLTIACTAYSRGAKVTFTNGADVDVYLSVPGEVTDAFKIRGTPYSEHTGVIVKEEDSTSQTDYQKRSYSLAGKYHTDSNDLRMLCAKVLAKYRNPQPIVRMKIMNSTSTLLTQILTRKISDRITVNCPKLSLTNVDFFINKIEHEITNGGKYHTAIWSLAKAGGTEGEYWTLDVSSLGVNTRLY